MSHIFLAIIFLLAVAASVFASHFLLYYSLIHFFRIVSPDVNNALVIVLSILAVSFVVASLLAHWRENAITRIFYFAAGLWLGLLVNLLIALFIAWSVWAATGSVFHHAIDSVWLGIIAVLAAFCFSIWGIFNAFNPKLRHISVKIKNLPEVWRGKRAIHISDIHLGHVYRQRFLKDVVRVINTVKPEVVFITGDLFDGMDGKLEIHAEPLNDVYAPQGIFFITGNHETYFGVKRATDILSKTKVRILSDECADVSGLRVLGLSYPENFHERDVAGAVRDKLGGTERRPTVLLYHSPEQIDEIIKTGLVDLQLSGHTHRGQLFPFNYLTSLIFRGRDFGLHRSGDYTLYISSGVGAWGPSMRTNSSSEIVVINFE